MFSKSAKAILDATRQLFKGWWTMVMMATTYTAMLTSLYFFASTREATVAQLILTLLLAVAAPGLFFLLQTASARYMVEPDAGLLLKESAKDFWKLVIISLPVLAFTVLALYALSKAQAHLPMGATVTQSQLISQSQATTVLIQWGQTAVTTVRYLLLCLVAPLLLIHLWIATSSQGLRPMLKWRSLPGRLREIVREAFAPESFLIYAFGFLLFAVIPYVIILYPTPTKRAWVEVSLLALRLLLSAAIILLGWITTVGALSISSAKQASLERVEEL